MFRRFIRRRRHTSSVLKLSLILTLLLVIISFLFESMIKNVQNNIIESKALALAEKSINSAVTGFIAEHGDECGEFISLNYGPTGEIETVTTNSMTVNTFKAQVDLMIQEELDKLHVSTTAVPLGAFTGMTLLSSAGPDIEFTYYLTASVHSELKSYFISGGINQTVHHIELSIDAILTLACLGHDRQIPFSTNFEIAETVIAGDVPNTYVQGASQVDLS